MKVLVLDVPNKPHAHVGQVLDLPEAEANLMIARGLAVNAPVEAVEPPAELPGDSTPAPDLDTELVEPVAVAAKAKAKKPRAARTGAKKKR